MLVLSGPSSYIDNLYESSVIFSSYLSCLPFVSISVAIIGDMFLMIAVMLLLVAVMVLLVDFITDLISL